MRIENPPEVNHPDIYLRQMELADAADWLNYLSMPEVYLHTSWNLASIKEMEPMFQMYNSTALNSSMRMAIIDKQTNSLIGSVGFHTISDINKSAEIAYDLAPAYWNRGIATAVCKCVTTWGFTTLGFVRIQATALQTNSASENVLLKCEYEYEGLLKSYRMIRGVPGDFKMFSKIKSIIP